MREVQLKPEGILYIELENVEKYTILTAENLPGESTLPLHSWYEDLDNLEYEFAWQVPPCQPPKTCLGSVYEVGLTVQVGGKDYTGHWKITVGNTPKLVENVEDFKDSIPIGARSYKFTELGAPYNKFTLDFDDAMKTPVDTVELIAGQGLSVEFDMVGLKGAELMTQDYLWD